MLCTSFAFVLLLSVAVVPLGNPATAVSDTDDFSTQAPQIEGYVPGAIDTTAVWNRTYGGDDYDHFYDLTACADGGYALVGNTYSFSEDTYDVWVVRTDDDGTAIWAFPIDYNGSSDSGGTIFECANGDFIIAGSTMNGGDVDALILRIDANGDLLWANSYGDVNYDGFSSVIETESGQIVAVGTTQTWSYGSYDVLLWCLDSYGNTIWFRHHGDTLGDHGRDIIECSDGGFAILADSYSYGVGSDFWLIRTDYDGNILMLSKSKNDDRNEINFIIRTIYGLT